MKKPLIIIIFTLMLIIIGLLGYICYIIYNMDYKIDLLKSDISFIKVIVKQLPVFDSTPFDPTPFDPTPFNE